MKGPWQDNTSKATELTIPTQKIKGLYFKKYKYAKGNHR